MLFYLWMKTDFFSTFQTQNCPLQMNVRQMNRSMSGEDRIWIWKIPISFNNSLELFTSIYWKANWNCKCEIQCQARTKSIEIPIKTPIICSSIFDMFPQLYFVVFYRQAHLKWSLRMHRFDYFWTTNMSIVHTASHDVIYFNSVAIVWKRQPPKQPILPRATKAHIHIEKEQKKNKAE